MKQGRENKEHHENDYANNYVTTGKSPLNYITNIANPLVGYPKLNQLQNLKKNQVESHSTKPFGVRCSTENIIPKLNSWINEGLKFDVIMIGALVDNQLILPILSKIPIIQLCSKPGFLFIWANTQKISELIKTLNSNPYNKKFRRSEELIFLAINPDSPYYPGESLDGVSLLERQQWHCWMCITGTVKRSTDSHLINCNIDTDLQIESPSTTNRNVVPNSMYKVAENFSLLNRRLHIIPSRIGYDFHIKLRPGWVIMGPDVVIDNFTKQKYEKELYEKSLVSYKQGGGNHSIQFLIPQSNEIEQLRPRSPVVKQENHSKY